MRRGLTTTVLLFVLIAIPLAAIFTQSVRSAATRQNVINTLQTGVQDYAEIEIANPDDIKISSASGEWMVDAPIYLQGELPAEIVPNLESRLKETLGRPARVRLILYQVVQDGP